MIIIRKKVFVMSDTNNQNSNKVKGPGFGKTVCVPFISGVLGATLVFGSIQGIPFLRDKFGRVEYVEPPKQEIFINNDEQISLQNASDTGVTVAQKVLPSVVRIKVEYEEYITPEDMYTKYKSGVISYDVICTSDYMIEKMISSTATAMYSVAYSASMVINLIKLSLNDALTPWIYDCIKNKNCFTS